jgi:hypothetical protein
MRRKDRSVCVYKIVSADFTGKKKPNMDVSDKIAK